MPQPPLIAIDVGSVRIGCAVGDPEVKIPFPVAVWPKAKNQGEKALLALLSERQPSKLIVGLPLNETGAQTAFCEEIRRVVGRIVKRFPIEVVYIDESHSSLDAEELMRGLRASKAPVDAIAACEILARFFAGANPIREIG